MERGADGALGVDAKQLERDISFTNDENRYECKDLDDKTAYCCKYSDVDVSLTHACLRQGNRM